VNVAIVGAGAWGTALGLLLHRSKHAVTLWGHDSKHLEELQRTRRNERYLPGFQLPSDWRFESNIAEAIRGCDWVVVAVPSKAIRPVTEQLRHYDGLVISVTKGIECDTGLTMCGVMAETVPRARAAALSGPSLALEVARGIPTAVVVASRDLGIAQSVQRLFHSTAFRVYTSTDLIGVEMGGALKNVVAIAAGIGDGFGFGDNSKASLLTRGIVEIRRLGVACGAQAETFSGLSGLGDLTVTCFSKLSRNRGFGERIGRGEKLPEVLEGSITVAEGYPTARAAYWLARRLNVSTPIIDEVYAVLYEGKSVGKALQDLMGRELKAED
jgi:glycerol-3-phosphate dehydrogenase (NAD(P)+)